MLFPQEKRAVCIDGFHLTLQEVVAVARHGAKVDISPEAIKRMAIARQQVEGILDRGEAVYGITTGFGALSQVKISREETALLQENLIKSHAAGCGKPFPKEVVRGILLLRANALCQGHSGIRPELVKALVDMLNAGVHPVIPEKGSLGASGDLAPLSHMALPLLGFGEAEYQGKVMPGAEAMRQAGISTFRLQAKEGLALINGTQAMASLGALGLLDALRLATLSDLACSYTMEPLQGRLDAFLPQVHALRPHKGQQVSARNITAFCAESDLIKAGEGLRVQDAYSIRCAAQVHGAVRGALHHIQEVLETEFNAVTDNPLLFPEEGLVVSGGHFHGEPLALALDYLAIAVAELANISERRLERLVNPQLSGGLPAFLAPHPGVNSGMMIVQYTAAALVSENKVLAHPGSVDSIPSSANQEDHVSMGMTAARKAREVVENAFSVLALEFFAASQALDLRGGTPSLVHQSVHQLIRKSVPFMDKDREIRLDIASMNRLIREDGLLRLAEDALKQG